MFSHAWQIECNRRSGVRNCFGLKVGLPAGLINSVINEIRLCRNSNSNPTNRDMKSRLTPLAESRNTRPNALPSLHVASSSSSLSSSSISIHPLLDRPRRYACLITGIFLILRYLCAGANLSGRLPSKSSTWQGQRQVRRIGGTARGGLRHSRCQFRPQTEQGIMGRLSVTPLWQ